MRSLRSVVRRIVLGAAALGLATVAAAPAAWAAAPSVTPNPVAPGGTITIGVPDSECRNDAASLSVAWVLLSSSSSVAATANFAPTTTTSITAPAAPGSYTLTVRSTMFGQSLVSCGVTTVVVAEGAGIPAVHPVPLIALGSIATAGAAVVLQRRRRIAAPGV